MQRKAQTTIFIVLAFVIALAVIIVAFLNRDNLTELASELSAPPGVAQIKGNIESCVYSVSGSALHYIGLQGGFNEPDDFVLDYDGIRVQYYYKKGKVYVPGRNVLENEIEKFIDSQLPICLLQLSSDGYLFRHEDPKSDVKLHEGYMDVRVDMPVVLKRDEKEYKLEKFNAKRETKILSALSIAEDVLKSSPTPSSKGLCLSCLSSSVSSEGMVSEVLSVGNGMIVAIEEKNSNNFRNESYGKYDYNKEEVLRFGMLF